MAQDLLTQAATAAHDGDLDALGELLSSSPRRVLTARDSEGRTLLDFACRAATGDIAIPLNPGTPEQHAAVDLLLNTGADINANPFRGTPLLWACYSDKVEAAAWLLEPWCGPRSAARLGRRRSRR